MAVVVQRGERTPLKKPLPKRPKPVSLVGGGQAVSMTGMGTGGGR